MLRLFELVVKSLFIVDIEYDLVVIFNDLVTADSDAEPAAIVVISVGLKGPHMDWRSKISVNVQCPNFQRPFSVLILLTLSALWNYPSGFFTPFLQLQT